MTLPATRRLNSCEAVAGLRLEINPTNLGFLKSCNRIAQLAKGDYLFFLEQ